MSETEDKLAEVVKTMSIKNLDLRAILNNLSDSAQEEIKKSVLDKVSDARLNGSWETTDTVFSYEMLLRLRNSVFEQLQQVEGNADLSKEYEALSKFFIKIDTALAERRQELFPTPEVKFNVNLDAGKIKEIQISKGKIIEAEFKEAKNESNAQ